MLKPGGQIEGDEALEFYAKHTAQIEVQEPTGAEPAGAAPGRAAPEHYSCCCHGSACLCVCGLLSLLQNIEGELFI